MCWLVWPRLGSAAPLLVCRLVSLGGMKWVKVFYGYCSVIDNKELSQGSAPACWRGSGGLLPPAPYNRTPPFIGSKRQCFLEFNVLVYMREGALPPPASSPKRRRIHAAATCFQQIFAHICLLCLHWRRLFNALSPCAQAKQASTKYKHFT